MSEENNLSGQWAVSLGFYPGVLIGMRTYRNEGLISHVFYVPFFDLAIQIFK